jgi:tetratricopeptide (TPR) repeat protein
MVVNMPYVDLPIIDLKGEWTVAEPERQRAAFLMAAIPPAPGPGADVVTRWNAAYGMLEELRDQIRDNAKPLFGDRASVTEGGGKVEMLTMLFASSRVLNEAGLYLSLLDRGDAKSTAAVAAHLDRLEPELARLRDLLVEAAGPLLEEKGAELVAQGLELWGRGDRDDAVRVTRQASGVLRHRAIADPGSSHHLATALSNLGGMLQESGRAAEALPVLEQSIGFRRLFAGQSRESTADLGISLANLGRAWTACGSPAKAIEALEESVEIHRGLAGQGVAESRVGLASSLNSLGNARGLDAAARRDFDEAIALLRELDAEHVEAVATLLPAALTSECGILLHLGERDAAVAQSTEAVTLLRRRAEPNPAGVAPYLTKALMVRAEALHAAARSDEALAAAEEATAIARTHATDNSATWRRLLADSLRLLAKLLTAVGRRRPAAAAAAEAGRLDAGDSLRDAASGARPTLRSRLWPGTRA